MLGKIHEPEAELAGAEEAIADAARLRGMLAGAGRSARSVAVKVPLWALLEALDALEPMELEQLARHIEQRLLAKRPA